MKTLVKTLRIAAIICSLSYIVFFVGMAIHNSWLASIGLATIYIGGGVVAFSYGLIEGGISYGLIIAFLTILLPILVLPVIAWKIKPDEFPDEFPAVFRRHQKPEIEPNLGWKCPKCGTVLQKPSSIPEQAIKGGARVSGTVMCGNCQSLFDAKDVYSGKYDI